jgi:DNA polymerase III delta prime subunit
MTNGTTTPDDRVVKAIRDARQRLLDLSRRNRMINYRQRKLWTLQIVNEIPSAIYDLLVLREQTMRFKPTVSKLSRKNQTVAEVGNVLIEELFEEDKEIWTLVEPTTTVESRHSDRYLQTNKEPEDLQKQLFRVEQTARAYFNEQGYTILYIALGFLNWQEAETSDITNTSPLILVPVEIKRAKAGSAYGVSWTGDDVYTNVSLKEKLKEQNVELPDFSMPKDKSGIEDYFAAVKESIRPKSVWTMGADIVLDFFSFAKFVMWKDLDEANWKENAKPKNHAVLQEIYTGRNESSPVPEINEHQIDERLSSKDIHHVVDADPSQICVIERIKAGTNLVVEGPPGTGKSQTIVNTIAELLAKGKRVLFVSEKMAALKVVKRKLDESGIGLFCLELHGQKTKRKSFIDALNQTLHSSRLPNVGSTYEFDDLERRKAELNSFAAILRTPFGNADLTPYRLFAMAERARRHFESAKRPEIKARIYNATEFTIDGILSAHRKLIQLADHIRHMHPLSSHPWTGTKPFGVVLDTDVDEVSQQLDLLEAYIVQLSVEIKSLVEVTGVRVPSTFTELRKSLKAARVVMESEPNDIAVLSNEEWNRPSEEAQDIIHTTHRFQELRREIGDSFDLLGFLEPPRSQLEQFNIEKAKPLRHFRPAYWKSKASVRGLYRTSPPKDPGTLVNQVGKLIQCIEEKKRLLDAETKGKDLFGSHWRGLDSDVSRLETFSAWIVQFRKDIVRQVLTEAAIKAVSIGVSRDRIERLINEIDSLIENTLQEIRVVRTQVGAEWLPISEGRLIESSISSLQLKFSTWKQHLDLLLEWSRYVRIKDDEALPRVEKIVELIESGTLSEPTDFIPAFDLSLSTSILYQVIRQNKVLANFSAEVHDGSIRDFRKLDKEILLLNQHRLKNKLYDSLPI